MEINKQPMESTRDATSPNNPKPTLQGEIFGLKGFWVTVEFRFGGGFGTPSTPQPSALWVSLSPQSAERAGLCSEGAGGAARRAALCDPQRGHEDE